MPRPGTDRSVPGRSRSPPARSSEPLASGHSPNPNRLSRRIPKAEVTDPFRVTDRHQPGLVCDPLSCGRRTNPTRGDATITKAERHFLIWVGAVSTRYSRGQNLSNRVQAFGAHAVQLNVPNAAPSVDSPSARAGSRRVFGHPMVASVQMRHSFAVLGSLLALICLGGCGNTPTDPDPAYSIESRTPGIAEQRFGMWMEGSVRARSAGVDGLYYAYYDTDTSTPTHLSPMISAEVLRYRLGLGEIAAAREIGEALLPWQAQISADTRRSRNAGAYPSEIAAREDGSFEARYLYDSYDSLAVAEALLDLFDATSDVRYLKSAERVGSWIRDVMSQGDTFALWLSNLDAPMKAVTDAGDFDNRIAVGRTLFFLPTLHRLSERTGDESYAALASRAATWLLDAQTPSGAFYDHYDPGYPPVAFDPDRFAPFGSDGSVVADDSLRAGLAAWQLGYTDAADSLADWVPDASGGVPGYLSLANGGEHFPGANIPYHDVISSSLHAALIERNGGDASEAREFVLGLQDADGGWHWGWTVDAPEVVGTLQSTLTGLWAFVDLLPQG